MIVVLSVGADGSADRAVEKKKCGTLFTKLDELSDWLSQKGVTEVVMESTAQDWKPVWLALENSFDLKHWLRPGVTARPKAERPISKMPRGWHAVI